MSSLKASLAYYRSQHKTLGCKLTHLVGVPLIALSIPMLAFSWRRASTLFCIGWIFQFVGHYCFEGNKPVLLSEARNPLMLLCALIYAADGWGRLLTGRPLVEREDEGLDFAPPSQVTELKAKPPGASAAPQDGTTPAYRAG